MESGCWCHVCFDPLGHEGAFQLPRVVWPCIPCRMHPTERATLYGVSSIVFPQRFYKLFCIQAEMSIGFEFNEWNLPLNQEVHRFMNFTQ